GASKHLPKPTGRNRRIANARDVRPVTPSSGRVDETPRLLFEGEELASFVNESGPCMGQDDVWILVEQPDKCLEIVGMVEVIMGGPLEEGRRRELEYPIVVWVSPQVPLIASVTNAGVAARILLTDVLGAIARSVVADQDLEVSEGLRQQA